MTGRSIVAAALVVLAGGGALAKPGALTAEAINAATFAPLANPPSRRPQAALVRVEVLLDRARFSPGAIDGVDGDNFRKALGAYQAANGLPVTRTLDQPTWDKLTGGGAGPAVVERKLAPADVKGPFVRHIPKKFEDQARLARLGYTNAVERMAEEVHATPGLLRALNPRVQWTRAGQTVAVPQVVAQRPPASVAQLVVDKAGLDVAAYGADGRLLAFYPASIGSAEKPAPSGRLSIVRVTHNPGYTYNPKYAFKGVSATKAFTIASGPNNPVGSVWMDLSGNAGYGIHGTPEPSLVGKTQSHGCIRLTNWDVEDLASMVGKDTPVLFEDQPSPDPSKLPPDAVLAAPAPAAAPAAPAPAPAAQPAASQP